MRSGRLSQLVWRRAGTALNSDVPVAFIPVLRDQLLPALLAGKGDTAAANLTITQGGQESVYFSDPFITDVRELVVTGPDAAPIKPDTTANVLKS
jgi:ABC-type amino acid transport substrate-binding protein